MAENCDPRILAAFNQATANLTDACNAATDGFTALGRAFDKMQREAEESLTVEQRLKYYELRDLGVDPFDALKQVSDWNDGEAVRNTFTNWQP